MLCDKVSNDVVADPEWTKLVYLEKTKDSVACDHAELLAIYRVEDYNRHVLFYNWPDAK